MVVIWPAGRISLLITDSFQGLISYPIFVIIAGYIFYNFAWGDTIAPVMMDRVDGENFLNPFDIEELRDFILANWRDTAIAADTIARARSLSGGGRRPRVRERVSISRLAPLSE